jgi:hypothetical protein
MDNKTTPLTAVHNALLRRLIEAGGGLFRYQIEPELAGIILDMERAGLVERNFRQIGRDGSKMLKTSITAAGRSLVAGVRTNAD